MYVADYDNNNIRMIDTTGFVYVTGTNAYVSDEQNNCIRRLMHV
jgi:hypothetical protein